MKASKGKHIGLTLLFFLILGGLSSISAFGQHSRLFSQYLTNGMAINPGYTGSRDALSLGLSFRKQWLGFKGSPMNQALFAHMPLKDQRNNVGMLVFNDRIGVSNYSAVFFSYAFRLDFKQAGRIALGLQGGLSMTQQNYMNLYLRDGEGVDANFVSSQPFIFTPRSGFGLYYDHDKFFAGFSIPQILEISDKGLGPRSKFDFDYYLMTAGFIWQVNPDLAIRPSTLIKFIKNSPLQFDLSTYFVIRENLWLGLSYRHLDAIIVLAEYQLNPQLRLGYSFDQSLTRMIRHQYGSHELFIRYELKYGVKAQNTRYF